MWLLIIGLSASLAQSAPVEEPVHVPEEVPAAQPDSTIQSCDALIASKDKINEEALAIIQKGQPERTKAAYERSKVSAERARVLRATEKDLFAKKVIGDDCKKRLNAQQMLWVQKAAGAGGKDISPSDIENATKGMNVMVDLQTCATECMQTHSEDRDAQAECAKACGENAKESFSK